MYVRNFQQYVELETHANVQGQKANIVYQHPNVSNELVFYDKHVPPKRIEKFIMTSKYSLWELRSVAYGSQLR